MMDDPITIPWDLEVRRVWVGVFNETPMSIHDWVAAYNAVFYPVGDDAFVIRFTDPVDAIVFKLRYGL